MVTLSSWQAVKEDFLLDPNYIHLGLGMLTPHPKIVRDEIEKHRKGFDTNPTLYFRHKDFYEDETLAQAASYLHTSPTQIALTESTTMGLALVYRGLNLQKGQEVLTTCHEHYAALETFRKLEEKEGIRVHHIELYDDDPQESTLIDRLLAHITPKTALVALTWVHSSTGVRLPIEKIGKAIASINATRCEEEKILLGVDGLHGFGVHPVAIESFGVDFFIAGCHKWLFGPRGTGIVWGSERGWQKITPLITSFKVEAFWPWYLSKNPDLHCPKAWLAMPGGFQAFEHRFALPKAFEYHKTLNPIEVEQRVQSLASLLKEGLAALPKVTLKTPHDPKLSSGMVCFEVANIAPNELVERLLKKGVLCGQTPYRKSLCRFTPGLLNDEEEIHETLLRLQACIA